MKTNTDAAKQNTSAADQKYTVSNSLVTYYLLIMFGFFPLFLTDRYAHARVDKYWLYMILTGVLTISVAVCALINRSEAKRVGERSYLVMPLTSADILMLCFWGFAAVSTVFSAHFSDAVTGGSARNNGLLLLTAYMLMYFVLTRHYRYKSYAIAVYLIVSSIVALLTVLNFYYIDPLGMLKGYDEATINDFGSTIGNKNIIATFMCLFLPVSMMGFALTENKVNRIISAVSIVFAYTGLICADSTSDIFGLVVIIPVMLILCARSYTYLRRYMLALTIMFASGKLLHLISLALGDKNKGFEFMQEFLLHSPVMYAPIVVCGLLYIMLKVLDSKLSGSYKPKAFQITLGVIFGVAAAAVIGLFIYYSAVDKETDLGNFEKILRFSDRWGTHRGFMWRVSIEEYRKFNIFNLLFGSGPDTAYFVLTPHFEELLDRFGDASTDCAHNEYINYLLTQGALGLAAYLGFMGAIIIRGIKTVKKNPMTLIFVSSVICYLAQATVNLYNPIVTPILFIFASLAEALSRQELLSND